MEHLGGFTRDDIFRLKLHLLSEGLYITPSALIEINRSRKVPQSVRSGASSGLDIVLPGNVWINAPLHANLGSEASPTLHFGQNGFVLEVVSIRTECPVVVLPKPDFYNFHTAQGIPMDKIGQIFADRIGFGLINQCYFWKKERRCAFCTIGKNIKHELHTKPEKAILETLMRALDDHVLPPRHILLSGGTFPHDGWTTKPFAHLANLIRQKTKLPIYLMAVPPADLGEISLLFESQISEIALNIEVYSKKYATKFIPGKMKEIGVNTYLKAISKARNFWDRSQVRSLLVAGLEPITDTLDGIKAILEAGGTPILSAFRPLTGSTLSSQPPPTVSWLETLYFQATDLAKSYGASLGPKCDACKANCLA